MRKLAIKIKTKAKNMKTSIIAAIIITAAEVYGFLTTSSPLIAVSCIVMSLLTVSVLIGLWIETESRAAHDRGFEQVFREGKNQREIREIIEKEYGTEPSFRSKVKVEEKRLSTVTKVPRKVGGPTIRIPAKKAAK